MKWKEALKHFIVYFIKRLHLILTSESSLFLFLTLANGTQAGMRRIWNGFVHWDFLLLHGKAWVNLSEKCSLFNLAKGHIWVRPWGSINLGSQAHCCYMEETRQNKQKTQIYPVHGSYSLSQELKILLHKFIAQQYWTDRHSIGT